MELGRHIAQELGLETSNDTLGRWMAHHIAELITAVERAEDPGERAAAREQAEKTILRVWEHRASEGHLDPLVNLKPALRVLAGLDPDSFPWQGRDGAESWSEAARRSHRALQHLTSCLALLACKHTEDAKAARFLPAAVLKHLTEDEQSILSWLELTLHFEDEGASLGDGALDLILKIRKELDLIETSVRTGVMGEGRDAAPASSCS